MNLHDLVMEKSWSSHGILLYLMCRNPVMCCTWSKNQGWQHPVHHIYMLKRCSGVHFTDIERRSQTSYTAPCNRVVSHGALIGGVWVFEDHTGRNKRKQNASMIFTLRQQQPWKQTKNIWKPLAPKAKIPVKNKNIWKPLAPKAKIPVKNKNIWKPLAPKAKILVKNKNIWKPLAPKAKILVKNKNIWKPLAPKAKIPVKNKIFGSHWLLKLRFWS